MYFSIHSLTAERYGEMVRALQAFCSSNGGNDTLFLIATSRSERATSLDVVDTAARAFEMSTRAVSTQTIGFSFRVIGRTYQARFSDLVSEETFAGSISTRFVPAVACR